MRRRSESTENLHPTIELKDTKTDWQVVDFPDIRRDGSFELSLPPGKAKLSFGGLSAAIVEPRNSSLRLRLVSKLHCLSSRFESSITFLANSSTRNISRSAARSHAYVLACGASEYVTCDADGKFSIPPDIIVETVRHRSSPLEVSVIGFDLKSGKCAMQAVENWQTAQDLG